jgi:Domain of unknown function (DUF5658)
LVRCSDDGPLHARYLSRHTISGCDVGDHFNSHPTTVFRSSMNTLRDLLILNLTLQVFDGLFSYQVFSLGAEEANPIVAAAISNWGVIYGLLYKKTLACVLLLLIFALRHRHELLVKRAMVLTASAYACVTLACLWKLLS